MSILKMRFVSIVGRKDYFDDFVYKYIIDSRIQLENALSFLENVKGLSPFNGGNPYYGLVTQSSTLITSMGLEKEADAVKTYNKDFLDSVDNIRIELESIDEDYKKLKGKSEFLKEQANKYNHMEKQLELLVNLDVDIEKFFNFEFIKFRFGRIPKKSYKQLLLHMDNLEVIVTPVTQDEDYVWLIYFTPRQFSEKVDGIFSSLYFERIWISGELKGTPVDALRQINEKLSDIHTEQKKNEDEMKELIKANRDKVISLYCSSLRLNRMTEVRKYASHTNESFYIIGWMPEEDLKALTPIFDEDEKIIYIQEEPNILKSLHPPTELKNNRIFEPFEALVRMYGLPSYNEIDPTTFVGITYFIMFGLMFGDVGQGLVLLAGGLILMKLGVVLGGVVFGAGLSSSLFGFLYGSIFGFENWLEPLWIRPMDNINTMLTVGISVGVLFLTTAMILNIVNGIKSRNFARIFLDRNGIAGFIFYWGAVILALYSINKSAGSNGQVSAGSGIPAGLIVIVLVLPIIAMFLKEPVESLLHKKKFIPQSKGVFFVQTFFELVDTVLSFISNTISFIRLSAFALNHAGLFMAVLILAEMTSGFLSVVDIIIGNILIIGMEGLIVGIQALRLEYYELFSRFFTGDGRPFRPLRNQYN